MPPKPLLSRPFDMVMVFFFLSHIPITIFIDSQAVFPRSWYSERAVQLLDWYLEKFGDPLMTSRPPWFRVLTWNEILLQLPFFFVGTYAFAAAKDWIQKPAIVYGVSTATTLLPILGELVLQPNSAGFNRMALVAFYLPYLIVPLALAVRMLTTDTPFPLKARRLPKKRV